MNANAMPVGNRWRLLGWGFAAAVLLTPLVAMRFTHEVSWSGDDFAVMGGLIGGSGMLLELAVRASGSWSYRAGAVVALVAAFLLIWLNLAVGIIGSEDDAANLMFAGVLTVAAGGACIAHFRSVGMARAMAAAALAQVVVGAAAVIGRMSDGPRFPYDVILPSCFFALLWLIAAAFFGKAARAAG